MAEHNRQLARIFDQMAQLVEVLGGNRFRVGAFEKASRVLGELPNDISQYDRTRLTDIDGIGQGTADRIVEFLDTGQIDEHQKLLADVPAGLLDVLAIPGVGPKSVATLWRQGGVTDLASLKQKLETGELEDLPRMGKKTLDNINASLAFAQAAGARRRIGEALPLARWFVDKLRGLKQVNDAAYAGSLRRGCETIGDIDLIVCADAGDARNISDLFVAFDGVTDVLLKGQTKTSVRTEPGLQVDLRIIEPAAYGAALIYFTGSKAHNIRLRERAIAQGYKLSEYGLFNGEADGAKRVAGETEREVYDKLGLAWIEPELREDHGEIALAAKGTLPALVELKHIQSELHTHTTASDGHWSIRELALAVADRGFHTLAVTDHSRSQVQANGLTASRLEEHVAAVREAAAELDGRIRLLAGAEVDILSDGKLDYPDSVLATLDVVVASPHAALSQEPAKATRRLLKAIENRYVTILGHPTGRLVNRREGLHPDIKQVAAAAAQRGIAVEVNANHHRLDLRDVHARVALEAGCKLAINTDAHGHADLDQLVYGVLTARRAGATRQDVVNTFNKAALTKWLKSTRK
ncbi:MAG: DNA polymerase/3'-5' exonuclease PolX [Phycisphaeraceae bacterium]